MVAAGGDLANRCAYPRAVIRAVGTDIDYAWRRRGRQTFAEQPGHRVAVAFLGVELEGDPAEGLVGFQQQPVDGLAERRSRPAGPRLSLSDAVAGDAQLVAVQLDLGQHIKGQDPVTAVLVEQVFLAVAFGQRRGQHGS